MIGSDFQRGGAEDTRLTPAHGEFQRAAALPIGLVTAIFLSEYAPTRVRAVLKPVLEILAGIPTVVYGFFAVIIIAPSLQDGLLTECSRSSVIQNPLAVPLLTA